MITRSSIAYEDFLGSSIASKVMPPWVVVRLMILMVIMIMMMMMIMMIIDMMKRIAKKTCLKSIYIGFALRPDGKTI